MLISKYAKKIVNFCDSRPNKFTNEIVVQCDGTKSTIEATDGQVGCQYTFHSVNDTDGCWSKALTPKVWGQVMTQASNVAGIDVQDRSPTEFTFQPTPNPDQLTVTISASTPLQRPSINDVTDTGETITAKVDPKLLKKICDAAISAKAGDMTLEVPIDHDKPVVMRGTTNQSDGTECGILFVLAQMGQ